MRKKGKVKAIILPNIKLHDKTTVTKTVEYRHKTTYMKNGEAESRAQK